MAQPAWLARWRDHGPSRPQLAQLVAAVGDHRPIEARLSGGFAYGPPPSPMRGADAPEVDPDVRIATAEIEKIHRAHETPLTEDALGVAYLVSGDLDRSVPLLEDAVDQQPGNGDFQNDLAAAYLAQARRFDRAEDYPKALAAAERAIKADPGLTEAWFNRALALEALYLTGEARKAWTDYLQRDSTSKWADEARKHLAALPADDHHDAWDDARPGLLKSLDAGDETAIRQVVDRFGQDTREAVENDFLPRWGDAIVSGDRVAASLWLTRAERLARVIAAEHHDGLPIDAVTYAKRMSTRPIDAHDLAVGYKHYRAALNEYYNDQFDQAAASFKSANSRFQRARTPSRLWTAYWLGVAQFHRANHPAAVAVLLPLRDEARAKGYPNLLGHADWMLGLIRTVDGRLAASLSDYRESIDQFRKTGERRNRAMLEDLLADSFEIEGEPRSGWTERLTALRDGSHLPDARLRHVLFGDGRWAALRGGSPEAGLYFQNALLHEARFWATPDVDAEALLTRAEVEGRLHETRQASADLRDAEHALKDVSNPNAVMSREADIAIERAVLEEGANPRAAIDHLDKGIVRVEKVGQDYRLPALRLVQAHAYRRMGNSEAARRSLLEGIGAFERTQVPAGVEEQAEYLDQSWNLFAALTGLDADLGHTDAALQAAELGHAPPASSLTLDTAATWIDEAVASLPRHAAILYYASLDKQVIGWVLSREHRRLFAVPVSRATLQRRVKRLVQRLQRSDEGDSWKPVATSMYDTVIGPAATDLVGIDTLIIVPGNVLDTIPFSALFDGRSDRF
ncbi:MAG TPA: tetratricopeptide repeat protein, partial [Vicinamibacterales bacterium]